jgi:iron complex transport system permease protein
VCLPAALTGAALLMAAVIAVRLIPAPPNATAIELKLGVVTALIGVPFFIAMIFRERHLLAGSPS